MGISNSTDSPSDRRPTFSEFAAYLLSLPAADLSRANDHWRPQWLYCRVCQQEYDVPGRLDTVRSDAEYILRRAGVEGERLEENNRSGGSKHGRTRRHPELHKYFEELQEGQAEALFEMYRPDFEILGYDMGPYEPKAVAKDSSDEEGE